MDSDPRRVKRIRVKRSPESGAAKTNAATGVEIPNDA
jgi:hypothetical protein